MVINPKDYLLREVIKVNINAGEIKVVPHRIGTAVEKKKPNSVMIDVANKATVVEVVSCDKDQITIKNTGENNATVEIVLEYFHSIEADIGMTDATVTPPVYSDGSSKYYEDRIYINAKSVMEAISSGGGGGGGTPPTPEDPWIRYVDSVSGDDSNDGKTPSTAWKTIAKALSQIPQYDTTRLIKLKGTFNESVVYTNTIGTTAFVGEYETVYSKARITSAGNYVKHGNNTASRWTEIVLTEDPTEPITWDSSLLNYYIELQEKSGSTYYNVRAKILNYDAANKRLYVNAQVTFDAGTIPQTVKIVRIATEINGGSSPAMRLGSISYAEKELNNYNGTIMLHALRLTSDKNALWLPGYGRYSIGDIEVNSKLYNINCDRYVYIQPFAPLSCTFKSIVDPNIDYASSSIFTAQSYNSSGFLFSGRAPATSFYSLNYPLDVSFADDASVNSIYSTGTVTWEHTVNKSKISGKVALRCIRASNAAQSSSRIVFYGSSAANASIGFVGTPDSSYGRVFLHNAEVDLYYMGIKDDVDDTYTGATPLFTMAGKSKVIIRNCAFTAGSSAKPLVCSSPVLFVSNSYIDTCNATGVTIYHGSNTINPATPTIYLTDGADFLNGCTVNVVAKTTCWEGSGIIFVDGGSTFRYYSQSSPSVTINHSIVNTDGHCIVVRNSKFDWQSNYPVSIDTTLTGYTIVCINGEFSANQIAIYSSGGRPLLISSDTKFRLNTMLYVPSLASGLTCPLIVVTDSSTVSGNASYALPSGTYGSGGIWLINNNSSVIWNQPQPSPPHYNYNSSAGGVGVEIRNRSSLINRTNYGPSGAAGDILLGALAPVAISYPLPGSSTTDIPAAAPSSSQSCSVSTM